jgi:hypothetical protein
MKNPKNNIFKALLLASCMFLLNSGDSLPCHAILCKLLSSGVWFYDLSVSIYSPEILYFPNACALSCPHVNSY